MNKAKTEIKKIKMQDVKHKLVVMSGKGGVGKSTVAANLAVSLAEGADFQVGVMDADLHGPNIPKILGVEDQILAGDKERIKPGHVGNVKIMSIAFALPDRDAPVVWRGPLKMKAIRQFIEDVDWGALEYLVIDLPPGTGDEPLSIAQLIEGIDGAIIVTTPQDLALLDSRKAVNFARKLEQPVIGIVENMSGFVCPNCGQKVDIFKTGGGEKAAEELGVPFLGRIPLDPRIVTTGDDGTPFVKEFKDSQASRAFAEIVEECKKFMKVD